MLSGPCVHSTLAQPWCRSLFGASRYVDRPTWAAEGCPQPCAVDAMGPAEGAAAAPGPGGAPAVHSAQQVLNTFLLSCITLCVLPSAICAPVSGAAHCGCALTVAGILLQLLQAGAHWLYKAVP